MKGCVLVNSVTKKVIYKYGFEGDTCLLHGSEDSYEPEIYIIIK